MTIQEFKTKALKELTSSPTPSLDIQVLLEHSTGYTKTQLLLKRNDTLSQEALDFLEKAILQRKNGLPVAYITGRKEFYGYNFFVTPDVLIPKPDTEILVEKAVDAIVKKLNENSSKTLQICDMCTGSGCIALAVLRTLTDVHKIPLEKLPVFTMADISPAALEIARKNAANLLIFSNTGDRDNCTDFSSKIRFVQTNLFEQIPENTFFEFILTNPPYIPHTMVDSLLKDGRNEPRLALDGDVTLNGTKAVNSDGTFIDDGLEIIRNLIPQAKNHLVKKGRIFMETGEYNAKAAASLAENYGFTSSIHTDLEGQLRVVELY